MNKKEKLEDLDKAEDISLEATLNAWEERMSQNLPNKCGGCEHSLLTMYFYVENNSEKYKITIEKLTKE